MALSDFFEIAALEGRERWITPRRLMRFIATASALALGSLLAASPAAAAPCQFAPTRQIDRDTGVEPQLLIDGTCTDPDYNESTFVVDKTEELTFQGTGGPPVPGAPPGFAAPLIIPYTQVTGHFLATKTVGTLPAGVRQSPTTFPQNYVFRFPDKKYWKNRSFEQQHPSGGGVVDNRLAFTNGAYSVNWMSASISNSVASHRHEAAATLVAKAYANKLYGNTAKIYTYVWGCSGGGTVAMAQAENVTGIWDGVQVQCTGTKADAQYFSFYWSAHYAMAMPKEKAAAVAAAAVPGSGLDVYAGLNEEEKSVLNEFIAAGYPLPIIANRFTSLTPLVDPIDVRMADPTYEDDFWSKPGYQGVNPPNYLKAALTDGWATITGITRDAAGAPTAIQFDPATLPKLGTTGDNYLEYWVYAADGKKRLIDPTRAVGNPTDNKARYSLLGKFDTTAGTLTLTGNLTQGLERGTPITNSPVLLGALTVGSKVRINNRFILAMYYYPRYILVPGVKSQDQYRNANGSAKYPQRPGNHEWLLNSSYRTMGGRVETGAIKTKTMILEGMGDNLSWPIFNAGYAEEIQKSLGAAKANDMMRFYLHDNGNHGTGGGNCEGTAPCVFQQSIQDLMDWVEKGVAPPPSTSYTIKNGQVILPDNAADRHGLQPVMNVTANGGMRAVVGVNQPVNLVAKLEMPPATGKIVQYSWIVTGPAEDVTILPKPQPEPQPLVNVNRTMTFDKPGTYVVKLTVSGQRDGQVNPANQTLVRNFKEVRVVVQ